jgi:dihydroneopterin aldolase
MDKVYIRGLEVETVIGIYDWERRAPQRLIVSVEMDWDIRPAACSENIEAALNYKSVSDRLIEHIRASRCQLVETLAEQLAQLILTEFNVPRVRLELAKPGAVGAAQAVGVIIERGRASA